MRNIFFILMLLSFPTLYAQDEGGFWDIDKDGIQDSITLDSARMKIICKLSTQDYKPIESLELDNYGNLDYIKEHMSFPAIYLEDFSDETYFDFAKRCAALFHKYTEIHQESREETEYEIKISDVNNEAPLLNYLLVDDSVYVSKFDVLNDSCHFKVSLSEGKHRIQGEVYGYNLLDTIMLFTPQDKVINLAVNMINDFLRYEFKTGFEKVYGLDPVIGLKNDGTFLRKSFLHTGGSACFQFEEGRYKLDGNKLILNVEKYRCPCNARSGQMFHSYTFTLKDNKITDLDKYNGFIENKLYPIKE